MDRNTEMPLVSVVIPVYNAQDTIEYTAKSVLSQSFNDFEIIFINDGSTDNSLEKIKKIKKDNNNYIIHIISQENGGVSKARNVGMKYSKGKYIALLDSDDEWTYNKLEKQVNILQKNPSIDFLGCNRNNKPMKILWKKYDKLTKVHLWEMLLKPFPSTPTSIFKKEILKDVGYYDENQRYSEDVNLWIRIFAKKQCYMMPDNLVFTGMGKPNFGHSGLSGNMKGMHKGEIKNLKDTLKWGYISYLGFFFLLMYTKLKYLRRILIVKMRR